MRVLLDTNILIDREDHRVLPEQLRRLLRELHRTNAQVLVHPLSYEDLSRDCDNARRRVALSKLDSYRRLEAPPDPERDLPFLSAVGPQGTRNDQIDVALLYAVKRDAVDLLITEDTRLLRKSSRVGLKERTLSVEDAISVLVNRFPDGRIVHPPALREDFVYNLDLSDSFFDSLKEDYGPDAFGTWFRKISREGRKCWVFRRASGTIGALLIYKVESEAVDSVPSLPAKRRFKIATMKVAQYGQKIGELLIKLSVRYCLKNSLEELYLTHHTKPPDRLVDLIQQFGFEKVAMKSAEDVFLKTLTPDRELLSRMNPVHVSTKYWPCFRDSRAVTKLIIPIQPEYHDRLFTDFEGRQTKLYEHTGEFIIEGNTIKKAYLTHSRTRKVSAGDVVLFYRSHDVRGLTSLGVVESVNHGLTDVEDISKLIQKRTVYSAAELKLMAKKPTTVILFNWHLHFDRAIGLAELIRNGVLSGSPQSIVAIPHERYKIVMRRAGIGVRLAVSET